MKKYKIVVLCNLDSSTHTILKSTVSLAKMINGDIEVFCVKNPTEIVNRENQLSAIRTINKERTVIDKKLRNLISGITEKYGTNMDYSFAIGNVKNELTDFIEDRQPDIIVLGKRKEKLLNFIGDKITQFVLNTYKGAIMIVPDKNALEPNKQISLGMLNNLEPSFNLEFAEDLMGYMQKPLKSFKIIKNSNTQKKVHVPANDKKIEYVFEESDGAFKGLSNYLMRNKIDLLYVDRAEKQADKYAHLMPLDIKDIVNNLNVTLLVTGEHNYNLQ